MKVLSTEIIDNTVEDMEGNIQPSGVSVLVEVEIDNVVYELDYQTTETSDYNAYSSTLAAYPDGDYFELSKVVGSDSNFGVLLENIANKAKVQKVWRDYVNEKFVLNDDYFNGIDARSEVNKAIRR